MNRFKDENNKQNMIMPVVLEKQLLPGTFEYVSCKVIEKIDLSNLKEKYKNENKGAKAYPPSALLKIILNAYAKGIISSRDIENLCNDSILFHAISGDLHPDHSTIANFISSLEYEIEDIFTAVLLICAQHDLIGGEIFALDGCKLSSNAAKSLSGTFKELENKKRKLGKTLKFIIAKHKETDKKPKKKQLEKTKKHIQDKIDKITEYILNNEPKQGSRGRENKSNITDNESAKMHSPHGIIQGYNGISMADSKHQVVVNADAFGSVSESKYLPEIVDRASENLRKSQRKNYSFKGKKILADTNYFSEENCKFLLANKIDGYIPDKGFRKRDPRFPEKLDDSKKRSKYKIEDFKYNKDNDSYICPQGKSLSLDSIKARHHGYAGRQYIAKEKDCSKCIKQYKCLRKGGVKRRHIFIITDKKEKTFSVKMIDKIDTIEGRNIYAKRMGIIEPVFANIAFHKKMNRFTLRGRSKVRIQWILFNLVHNIGKIARYGNMSHVSC